MKLFRLSVFALIVGLTGSAEAQTSFQEWYALEMPRNLARLHAEPDLGQLPSGLVVRYPVRVFADATGRQIIVGQVDNVSSTAIVFPRVEATFFDRTGRILGTSGAQVFSPAIARLAATHAVVDVLPPGATGFFKIWSDEQYAAVARSALSTTAYFAKNGLNPVFSAVTVEADRAGPATEIAGRIHNLGPLTIYQSIVAAAGFRDGAIYDVAVTAPVGSTIDDGCGQPSRTGTGAGVTMPVLFQFSTAVERIGATAAVWEEIGTFPAVLAVSDGGGDIPVTIVRKCGWNGSSQAEWIRGNETQTPSGLYHASLTVDPNPLSTIRTSTAKFSDIILPVLQQAAGTCKFGIDPRVIAPAEATTQYVAVQTQAGCSWQVRRDASQGPWISLSEHADVGSGVFLLNIDPNPHAAPRRQQFFVLGQWLEVMQAGKTNGAWFDAWFASSLGLLFQHDDGRLLAWSSTGGFDGVERVINPSSVDPEWKVTGTADFNADGESDILWQRSDGRLNVWLMQNAQLLSEQPLMPGAVESGYRVSCVGDLNRDGQADLIWQHRDGRVAAWLMDGLTRREGFLLTPGAIADVDWQIAGCGDFNQDGWLDVIWRNQRDGRVSAWLMNGATRVSGQVFASVADVGWTLGGVGDLDDDGWPDLFWHHSDGRVSVWLMNGLTVRDGSLLSLTMPEPGWRLVAPK